MKASDITDGAFLAVIASGARDAVAIEESFPEAPPKVLWAKRKSLLRRGLMKGCDLPYCGCSPYEVNHGPEISVSLA